MKNSRVVKFGLMYTNKDETQSQKAVTKKSKYEFDQVSSSLEASELNSHMKREAKENGNGVMKVHRHKKMQKNVQKRRK